MHKTGEHTDIHYMVDVNIARPNEKYIIACLSLIANCKINRSRRADFIKTPILNHVICFASILVYVILIDM